MGSLLGKGGSAAATTGFRYYFGVLAGICRGPIDEVFLIKSDGKLLFDGSSQGAVPIQLHDPEPTSLFAEDGAPGDGSYPGGSITGNSVIPLYKPTLYGGEESEGGITGFLWAYFGAKNQLIPAADWMRTAMAGLLLPSMRGVVTMFFDGEVTANNPYPKAWKYRVRRTLAGWDRGGPWYPSAATIMMVDSGIASYSQTLGNVKVTTSVQGPNQIDVTGASTSSSHVTEYNTSYENTTVTTYDKNGGIVASIAVPRQYNIIRAMNPAHIVYECVTNRDWGRGMDPALLDISSFTAAADKLVDENFGLCLKWSRSEDIDTFVQTVIDHIGGVVYTDRVTGLLCMRLIRGDYDATKLSVFDYAHGLLEVTSLNTAASDTNPNEVIVKYNSPVLDADKEARQQNIASINNLGCVYSLTRDYSGLPTSDLAIRVAARDLRVASNAWKSITFVVDRRGYLITPGDCLVINAPERGLNGFIVRVATVEDTVMTDGKITIVGSQDAFGLPLQGVSEVQNSEWLPVDTSPKNITDAFAQEATYWDMIRAFNGVQNEQIADYKNDPLIGFQSIIAIKPSSSSLNFKIWEVKHVHFSSIIEDPVYAGVGTFSKYAKNLAPITISDTRMQISPDFDPRTITIPQLMLMTDGQFQGQQEFIYVTKLERDASTGNYFMNFDRGCIDTPSIPHAAGDRIYNYQQTANVDPTEYTFNDIAESYLIDHTSAGDLNDNVPQYGVVKNYYLGMSARIGRPYPAGRMQLNGLPLDALGTQSGDLQFKWYHRNKETQADKVLSDRDGDVIPVPGTQYDFYLHQAAADGNPNHEPTFFKTTTNNDLTVSFDDLYQRGFRYGYISFTIYTELSSTSPFNYRALNPHQGKVLWRATPNQPPPQGDGEGFDNDFDNDFSGA